MAFVRVRGAGKNDPLHEFDAPLGVVEANPELYVVIDEKPVATPRPALIVEPAPKPKLPRAARRPKAAPTAQKTKPEVPAELKKEG